MDDKKSIENEIRLYCVEWLCASTMAVVLKATGQGGEILSAMRKQALDSARLQSFSTDPTLSDHYSAELEVALDRLLKMTEFFLGKNQSL
jgi:hypothetical protein